MCDATFFVTIDKKLNFVSIRYYSRNFITMQYEDLKSKVKKAIQQLYNNDNFYGCKQYGESTYQVGDIELTISKERTFYSDTTTYVVTSSDFIIEYTTGSYDPRDGWGAVIWKSYENLEAIGDLEALDRALIWLSLAS